MSLIELSHVSKTYGEGRVKALSDVSLTVEKGEFVVLMGPSGCGKSTLLNVIGTLDRPTSGRVMLDRRDLIALGDEELTRVRRDKIGFIFQFFNLLSTLTVFENVALPLELSGNVSPKETKERVHTLLDQVGLGHRMDFYPAKLSGGEMQRVAIARALIHDPAVILADEPTGNLDTENGRHVLDRLKTLCDYRKQTVFMVTHSAEALEYADRVLYIRDGKLEPAPDVPSEKSAKKSVKKPGNA